MDIEQFYYLQEAVREQSINKAAQKIHISPQALSRSLIKLEEALDVQLYERSRHGIVATEQGKQIIQVSKQFLQSLNQICSYNISKNIKTNLSGEVIIPAMYEFGFTSSNIISKLRFDAPNLHYNFLYSSFGDIVQYIAEEKYEIALVDMHFLGKNNLQKLQDDIIFAPIKKYNYYCMVNAQLPFSKYKEVSLKTIYQYPIIIHESKYENSENFFLNFIKNSAMPPRIIHENNLSLIQDMVIANVGTYLFPAFEKNEALNPPDSNIAYVKLSDNLYAEFGYIVKKGKILSDMTQAIINILQRI